MFRTQAITVNNVNLMTLPTRFADTLLAWAERSRQRQHLGEMDRRLLSDMGISRGQALAEASKPFWRA